MSETGLKQAQDKMAAADVPQRAIDVFSHYYRELEEGATGRIPEDTIDALTDPPRLEGATAGDDASREAFSKTVIIKLNGGLGTSMGMDKAKSLLPVRDGKTFLELIVEQVRSARAESAAPLPLIFMNSFRTRADTLEALEQFPDLPVAGIPQDFLQNQEPKLLVDDLTPAEWPADPTLEWCPPGHGDLYTAIETSGMLQTLLDAGYKYASISNSDNLGATPSAEIAGWFAASGAPYAAEVCRRTAADRKGGHLALRKSDGRLILRDTAQTPDEDMHHFTDEHRHPYFHTNNLWFNLEVLAETLQKREGVLGLPLIRNLKNLDPADSSSPKVYQIETAMGAAVEVFEGAQAITVDRSRFLPVKTTSDLLLVRSDAYRLNDSYALVKAVDEIPLVTLDSAYYKKINDFDQRFPHGAPSLKGADSLTVAGDWTFGDNVTAVGEANLSTEEPQRIGDGATISS